MAQFHSLRRLDFPPFNAGVVGDVYFATDTRELFVSIGAGGMLRMEELLSANGPPGPQGPQGIPGVSAPPRKSSIQCVIDFAGEAPTTGEWASLVVPVNCTVLGWSLLADQTGSAVLDVKQSGTSITGSEQPTLNSSQLASDLDVSTSWVTNLVAGNVLTIFVLSASVVQRLTLALNISIP